MLLLLLQPRSFTLDITEGCGKTKGCYRNPAACSEAACDVVVTWLRRNDRSYEFELSADTDGWVALGLSDDKKMVCPSVYFTYFVASNR